MGWIDRRIEREREAERKAGEARKLSGHAIELLRREIPVLWRALLVRCEEAVATFNREFQSERVATMKKDSASTVRVELHRPGSAVMTARLVVDGYRIDYTLYRDGKPVEDVPSKITFELALDTVVLSGDGERLDVDGASRSLLEAVLFGDSERVPPAAAAKP